ncbi:MAG: glycosyltransferase [Candidatus Omnitrophica bacterium]|nr:glycosyltransferase [Candidatus Omnitrophota bacterium]MBU1853064.1 glycosyltransferase [Candidatus Omnitrophota bacterium]
MKKIVFINSSLSLGGAEKIVYEVIKGLDRTRFQIKSYCLYSPGVIGKALMLEHIDFNHSFMRNKYDLRGIYRLAKLVGKERTDVLYLQSSPLVLFWGFILGMMFKIPHTVTVLHGMKDSFWRERLKSNIVNRLILHRLDRIGVVSKAKLASLLKKYKLDPSKVELINNAVDIDRFTPLKDIDGFKKKIGITDNEKIIGIVGRLVTEKAYDVFLKSAQHIKTRIPNSKFVIVGDGRERTNLERLTKDLGLENQVIFLGERHDVSILIALFDVAVLSSRIESLPVVLLEYMAACRPIVATDVGGNSEVLLHGQSGLIVPPEEPGLIADAVIRLLNNTEYAKNMGMEARRRVEESFSLDGFMTKMERFFSFDTTCHILMAGPSLNSKGGISSFAKNLLSSKSPGEFKIEYHPTTTDANNIFKSVFFIKSLVLLFIRLLTDKNIKIIHICSASKGSFYRKAVVLLVSKLFKKSVIFHIHGGGFQLFYNSSHGLKRAFVRKILDLSDSIIVLSESWHSAVKNMTKNTNIKIIPNPIDTSLFESVRTRRAFDLNVFTAGRLESQKGTYDILDIVPDVLKEIPHVRFSLAGNGDIEKISMLCKERGIEKNVILLGWLDREMLLAELKKAALFLLPSYHEGLPISILEAMASGLPVISTKVGGIPEIIEDGVNGFLVAPGNKKELVEKIIGLLRDAKLKKKMAKNNIEKIDLIYRSDRILDRMHVEYKHLITE